MNQKDAINRSLAYQDERKADNQADLGDDVKYSAWLLGSVGGLVVCCAVFIWLIFA